MGKSKKKSYDMLVNGIGNKATSAIAAIENSYQKKKCLTNLLNQQ